jgi:hypothetical protein
MLGVLLFSMGAGGDADGSSALAIIREFGFPVFVALWFMWRVEKRMDRFTDVVQNLLTTVTIMAKTIEGLPSAQTPRAPARPPEAA